MSPPALYEVHPIGFVHTSVADADVARRRRDIESVIEILPEYAAGLAGIEEYSHLFVIFLLDRAAPPASLVAHPRGDSTVAATGVFAARGRNHPNGLGLAVVELLARDGERLVVRRLDAYDGTPILDIKPYDDYDRVDAPRVPDWWRRRTMTPTRGSS